MAWAEYDALITDLLTSRGYSEIPENKLPEASASNFKEKGYSLKNMGMANVQYTANDGMDYNHKCRLEIGYITQTPEQRDEKAVEFVSTMEKIAKLSDFISFNNDPSFDDYGDSKHCKGVAEIIIGVEFA